VKNWKIFFVVLNILLLTIVGILSQVLAARFPDVPSSLLWGGAGILIVMLIAVSAGIVVLEERSQEAKVLSQQKQRTKPQSQSGQPSGRVAPSKEHQIDQKAAHPATTSRPLAASTMPPQEPGQPSVDAPMLLCLAIDVSRSMRKSIVDHTGRAIQRWTTVQEALEEFIYLGAACVKDPRTQRILPLYNLMAYGFGFREVMHSIGIRKTPGGPVRDLLAHPLLSSLPSASDLSENWPSYKEHLLSATEYTGDLFGVTPLCQALKVIRDRIKSELRQRNFTMPVLLLILSDGLADDGDPLPLITELHMLGVITLCCYLADKDVLAPRQLYRTEEPSWTDGARLLFRCASALYKDSYVSRAIFDYLDDYGWRPGEGMRLFGQVNQTEALGNFLEVLLRPSAIERRA